MCSDGWSKSGRSVAATDTGAAEATVGVVRLAAAAAGTYGAEAPAAMTGGAAAGGTAATPAGTLVRARRRRNQYASTGTIVSDTSSEASSAIVDGERERPEQLAGDAADERDRQEHRDRGERWRR